jgi:hypothetical protein
VSNLLWAGEVILHQPFFFPEKPKNLPDLVFEFKSILFDLWTNRLSERKDNQVAEGWGLTAEIPLAPG